ncbi:MAG TPA: UdgX family uracil-DNA binding protein [Polyangiaceae bacterium]|jgi:DNA polymerase|nr:UdgX family uracil-DNA binding protein [Polyangiaceae bacterium]
MPTKKPPADATPFVPATRSLVRLASAAEDCEGCALYARATQTVFGRGPADAALVVVGEQPGDEEDRAGEPFVGPSGHVLDALLKDAGIDRRLVYVTNAVKHFKWEPRGKRRMHSKPNPSEVAACHPWLAAELALVDATVVVCLGATAAQSILGRSFRLTASLGQTLTSGERRVVATYHPSAILRMPTHEDREKARAQLRGDLERAWKLARPRG